MSLISRRKLSILLTVLVLSGGFLFILKTPIAQAYHATSSYNKLQNGTLSSANWNDLFSDFVNTWLPVSLNGPVGIATEAPQAGLAVNGPINATNIFSTGNVGIGTTAPGYKLDVNGTGYFAGLTYGVSPGQLNTYALTTVEYVNAKVGGSGGIGSGTSGQTLRHDGTGWVANSLLYNNGTNIGIGTSTLSARLHIGLDSSFTSGTVEKINWGSALTGAASSSITGLRMDFSNFTPNVTNSLTYGLHLTSPTVSNGTAYGLYLEGTGWDYAIYSADNVYFTSTSYFGDTSTYVDTYGNWVIPAFDGTNNYLRLGSSASNKIYATGTPENLILDSTGHILFNPTSNVGIGTTTPAYKLAVVGTGYFGGLAYGVSPGQTNTYALTTVEYVNAKVGGAGGVGAGTSGQTLRNDGTGWVANSLLFNDGTNIGIGTTNPQQTLHISGSANGSYIAGRIENTATSGAADFDFKNSAQMWKVGVNLSNQFRIRDDTNSANVLAVESGAGANAFYIKSGGNVGIGTTNPSSLLDINGTLKAGGINNYRSFNVDSTGRATITYNDNALYPQLTLSNPNGDANSGDRLLFQLGYGSTAVNSGYLQSAPEQAWTSTASTRDSYMSFATALDSVTAEKLRINSVGNVGIGTTTPSSLLHVNGIATFGGLAYGVSPGQTNTYALTTVEYVNAKVGGAGGVGAGTSGQTLRNDGTGWVANSLLYNNGTNIGIGTTNPGAKLDITNLTGNVGARIQAYRDGANYNNSYLTFNTPRSDSVDGSTTGPRGYIVAPGNPDTNASSLFIGANTTSGVITGTSTNIRTANQSNIEISSSGYVDFWKSGTNYAKINSTGNSYLIGSNVGVGTTNPVAKLELVNLGSDTLGQNILNLTSSGSKSFGLRFSADESTLILDKNYSAIWASVMSWNRFNGNVNIGTTTASTSLFYVNGTASFGGLAYGVSPGQTNTYALTTVEYVNAKVGGAGGVGAGTSGQTLRNDGTGWVANSLLYNNGTNIGIGTTSPAVKLDVVGRGAFGNMVSSRNSYGNTLSLVNASANDTSLFLWQNGVASAHIGFSSGSSVLRIANSTSDGSLTNTASINITSAGNVGIGTSTPAERLVVNSPDGTSIINQFTIRENTDRYGKYTFSQLTAGGFARQYLSLDIIDNSGTYNNTMVWSSGNVGVGTTVPRGKLEIKQNMSDYSDPFSTSHLRLGANNTVDNTGFVGIIFDSSTTANYGWSMGALRSVNGISDFVWKNHQNSATGTEVFRIASTGNVGIGSTTPAYKLAVVGTGSFGDLAYGVSPGQLNTYALTTVEYVNAKVGGAGGVGTGTIGQTLRHDGTSWVANSLLYNNGTNIGIGTTVPGSKLVIEDASGNVETQLKGASSGILTIFADTDSSGSGDAYVRTYYQGNSKVAFGYDSSLDAFSVDSGSILDDTNLLTIKASGNVGIGTTAPSGPLNIVKAAGDNLIYADNYSTTGGNSNYWFSRRSHSNTAGTLATTLTGDALGTFFFQGVNASATFAYGAKIVARQNGAAGTYIPTDLDFSTYSATAQNSNQLILSTNGNVGIGTTTASSLLYVAGTASFTGLAYGISPGQTNTYALTTVEYVNAKVGGAGGVGTGTIGQTLRHDGTGWVANSLLYNNGTNVGIGTTNPTSTLEIKNSTTTILTLASGSNTITSGNVVSSINTYAPNEASAIVNRVVSSIQSIADADYAGATAPTSIAFLTQKYNGAGEAVSEKMRITSSGNVGIGTTAPLYALHSMTPASTATTSAIQGEISTGNKSNNVTYTGVKGLSSNPGQGWANAYQVGVWGEATESGRKGGYGPIGVRGTANYIENYTSSSSPSGFLAGLYSETSVTVASDTTDVLNAYGAYVKGLVMSGSPTISNWYGLYLDTPSGTGTITNRYGLYQADASGKNYFAGDTSIGTTTSGYKLTVAGTASFTGLAYGISPGQLNTYALTTVEYVNAKVGGAGGVGTGTIGQTLRHDGTSWVANSLLYNSGTNIGIGTTTPAYKLDVVGGSINIPSAITTAGAGYYINTNDVMSQGGTGYGNSSLVFNKAGLSSVVFANGNVGIGITNPNALLHLNKSAAEAELRIQSDTSNSATLNFTENANIDGMKISYISTSNRLDIIPRESSADLSPALTILRTSGNTGIGSTTPAYKLAVVGTGSFGDLAYGISPNQSNTYALTTVEYVNAKVGGSGGVGSGTSGQTLRNDGTGWVANSLLYNNATNIGIGTTAPTGKLDVLGLSSAFPSATVTAGDLVVDTANRVVYIGRQSNTSGDNTNFVFRDRIGGIKSYWENASSGSVSFGNFGTNYGVSIANSTLGAGATTTGRLVVDSGSASFPSAIFTTGNVGVGTTNPQQMLHVSGSASGSYIAGRIENTAASGAADFDFKNSAQMWKMGVNVSNQFRVRDDTNTANVLMIESGAGANAFYIKSAGNVGIGITNPGYKFDVNGTGNFGGLAYGISPGQANTYALTTVEYVNAKVGGAGGVGTGTIGQTLRHDGTSWVANSLLYNNGTNIGIGATDPTSPLTVISTSTSTSQINLRSLRTGITTNYVVGGIDFISNDTSLTSPGTTTASMKAVAASSHTASSMNTDLVFNTTYGTTTVEAMRLRYVGRVGIGTSAPASVLHLTGAQPIEDTDGNGTAGTSILNVTGITGGNTSYATSSATGGAGSAITIASGSGGQATAADTLATGGAGGTFSIAGGIGGASAVAGTGNNTGGAGGAFSWIAGTGGAVSGDTTGNNTGGNGGAVTLRSGTGGAASNPNLTPGTIQGGTGGTLTLAAGAGGAGTGGTDGNGGPIVFQTASTTSLTERMRIINNGNVGIGTTGPASILHIKSLSPYLTINDNRSITWVGGEDLGGINIYSSDGSTGGAGVIGKIGFIQPKASSLPGSEIAFSTAVSAGAGLIERMRIGMNGNIGIGTSTATASLLNVDGTATFGGLAYGVSPGQANTYALATVEYVNSKSGGSGGVGTGTIGQTLRHDGTGWVANSLLYNNGTNIGIGTTTPAGILDIYKDSSSAIVSSITNPNTGASVYAELSIRNVAGGTNDALRLLTTGTGYSGSGAYQADAGVVSADTNLSGGLSLMARNSSGNIRFYTAGSSDSYERMRINSSGYVGIGTTGPATPLTVTSSSHPSLTLERTANNVGYGTVQYFRLRDSGNNAHDYAAIIGGIESNTDGSEGGRLSFSTSVSGSFVETIRINSASNVGIGTTAPIAKLGIYGSLYNSNGSVTFANLGGLGTSSLVMVDNSGMIYAASTSTLFGSYLPLAGGVMSGSIDMGNNNITNIHDLTISNKLTVSTIDPLYNLKGVNYSTFVSSIAGGVKEECLGKISLDKKDKRTGEFTAIIDFDKVEEGSDLWVWRQVVDFNKDNVEVLLTPYGRAAVVYYLISGNSLILRADQPVEVSYRLIGRRFDWRDWPTRAVDQSMSGRSLR